LPFEARDVLPGLASRALFFFTIFFSKKIKTEKKETRHSHHTVCDGVSGVTKEGGHPGVSVCLVSGTGSAVREVKGVFSVFFDMLPQFVSRISWQRLISSQVSFSGIKLMMMHQFSFAARLYC
jgi:hypothetical protein